MSLKISNRKIKDLLSGESVIVLSGGFSYNCTVEWTLADFMDDNPPFVEVNFNERCEGDTVYFTSDLSGLLYEFNDYLFVVEK